jgi:hypothetical protein
VETSVSAPASDVRKDDGLIDVIGTEDAFGVVTPIAAPQAIAHDSDGTSESADELAELDNALSLFGGASGAAPQRQQVAPRRRSTTSMCSMTQSWATCVWRRRRDRQQRRRRQRLQTRVRQVQEPVRRRVTDSMTWRSCVPWWIRPHQQRRARRQAPPQATS